MRGELKNVGNICHFSSFYTFLLFFFVCLFFVGVGGVRLLIGVLQFLEFV